MGVVETYIKCASTLALHPSSESWSTILNWSADGPVGRWAIADGVLFISPDVFEDDELERQLLQNEDEGKKEILKRLADDEVTLAIWEMKSLTVGTA